MESVNLKDVVHLHYGVIDVRESITGEMENYNAIILERNTPVPCEGSRSFYLVQGQTALDIKVTQCTAPEENPDFVDVIASLKLAGLPPGRPPGQEVKVTFKYNKNKMMECEFLDVASGIKQTLEIKPDDYQASSGGPEDLQVE